MGAIGTPKPVYIFASIIFKLDERLEAAEKEVRRTIGDVLEKTAPIRFYQTDYYEDEMGEGLSRVFLLFNPLFERECLPDIKLKTNIIEDALSREGKRTVNIDPGYLSLENIILATTKGYSHRIYLGKGIFGDLTLIYHNKTYSPLGWTYPDYGSNETISVLNAWRVLLKQGLNHHRPSPVGSTG